MEPETGGRSSWESARTRPKAPPRYHTLATALPTNQVGKRASAQCAFFYLCYHLWFSSGVIASFTVRVAGSVLIHQPLKLTHKWQIKSNNSTLEGQPSIFIWIAMFFNWMWLYLCCFQFLMILIILPSAFPLIYYWDHLLIPHRHLVHIYWMVASGIMIDTLGIK